MMSLFINLFFSFVLFFGALFASVANYDYLCKLLYNLYGVKCRKSVQSSAQSYKNIVKLVIRNHFIADNFAYGCCFGAVNSFGAKPSNR
jgi:cytochrome c oxidase assembly protein Cox11